MSVEPPPFTSTIKMAILKELNVVPEEHRQAALRLAGEVMAENTNQTIPRDEESSFAVLAKPIPRPFSLGSILPAEVTRVLREVSTLFSPSRERLVPSADLTPEEREDREKNILLPGGRKAPKVVPPPYSLFYPHMWMGKNFDEWARLWQQLIAGHAIADIHLLKYRRCESAVGAWFSAFAKASSLTPEATTIWFALVDVLAEVYLLTKHSGPRPSVATLNFAALVEGRIHASKALDYYSDLNQARVASEPPKNGFR